MGKPSIFSKNYQKKMKRRKITIITLIIIIIALGGTFILGNFSNFNVKDKVKYFFNKSKMLNGNLVEKQNKDSENLNTIEQKTNKNINDQNSEKKDIIKEKTITSTLSSGDKIYIKYEENSTNSEKTILTVEGNGKYSFDISPDKKKVVVLDDLSQDMKVIDVNLGEKDITKPSYTTSKGKTYNKEDILKSFPNQIWGIEPKFLDDNNIVYISNLPYFGDGDLYKYIWIFDLNTGEYKVLFNSKGKDIKFNELDINKLIVNIDGIEKVLDASKNLQ
ncbi:YncE family protein [Clostridium tarantellae]|uniref:Uncharacterized protein n=1 Tax=Clostridium tarantellae TaxID=39493 RepID=A0A6I1MUX0_9CLOT|nr:hypothetical protein [Clostridium tarantellae]MPQ44641.1 hypothetical protein [Clostridium tarantellae]